MNSKHKKSKSFGGGTGMIVKKDNVLDSHRELNFQSPPIVDKLPTTTTFFGGLISDK